MEISREREREREREKEREVGEYIYIYIYIYTLSFLKTEREGETSRINFIIRKDKKFTHESLTDNLSLKEKQTDRQTDRRTEADRQQTEQT